MTDESTRAGANPAQIKSAGEPDRIERLAVDLDDVHAMLHEATEIALKSDRGLATRMEAMTIATRILKACSGAHFVLARLKGEVPESRHRSSSNAPPTRPWRSLRLIPIHYRPPPNMQRSAGKVRRRGRGANIRSGPPRKF